MRVMRALCSLIMLAVATSAVAQMSKLPVPPISGAPKAMPQGAPTPAPTPGPYVGDWEAYMARFSAVLKVEKSKAVRLSAKWAKPNAVTPWDMMVVGEDEEYLYLKNIPIEDPKSPGYKAWIQHENAESALSIVAEQETKYFIIDPFAPLVPPPFTDRMHFEERSEGFPTQGKWQMGFAHADFNKDGLEDLVFPPARTGAPYPTIFLQTKEGWKAWDAVKWPQTKLDYGDVGVADFDGDGNLDIAIACHFLRNYVLYGNGKGDFTRVVDLPRVNPNVTSRALEIADFDGDKRPDVAFLSELDIELGTNETISAGLLFVCLNTSSGWRAVDASGKRPNLFGDQLAVGDFDADGHPDLLVSSQKNINRYLIFHNQGDGHTWSAVTLDQFPFRSFLRGVEAANLDGLPGDEAVMAYYQNIQSGRLSFPRNAASVYSFIVGPDGLEMKDRKMLEIDNADYSSYTCAAAGDIDGDGALDLVFGRQDGPVEVFLQDAGGGYLKEKTPEISLGQVWVNAIHVISLSAKGPVAIVVATSDGPKAKGSIRCFVAHKGALDSATRPQ